MTTAIPMRGEKISSHFKKAPLFKFFDEHGKLVGQLENPTHPDKSEDCSSTNTLMAEFERHQVKRIVVRNIGERMLTRLLPVGIEVWQTPTREVDAAALAVSNNQLVAMSNPAQGREPKNYLDKLENGGCSGCSGESHECEDKNSSMNRCCNRSAEQASRMHFGYRLKKLLGFKCARLPLLNDWFFRT